MSKRSSGASHVNGFIAINNEKTAKTSKQVKSGTSQLSRTSTKSVTKANESKEGKSEKKKPDEPPTSSRYRAIDVKITKRADASPSPRASVTSTSKTSSGISTKVAGKTTTVKRTQPASSKVDTSASKPLPKNKTTTSTVLKKPSITTVSSKIGLKKTSLTTTKLKTTVAESKRSNAAPIIKIGKSSAETRRDIRADRRRYKDENSKSIQGKAPAVTIVKKTNVEDSTTPVNEPVNPEVYDEPTTDKTWPSGPKRENTWIKENSEEKPNKDELRNKSSTKDKFNESRLIDESINEGNSLLSPDHEIDSESREESLQPTIPDEETYYEDDFEDYESDFEDYQSEESGVDSSASTSEPSESSIVSEVSETSDESETTRSRPEDKKLDSGNYDMRRCRTGFYHPPPSHSVNEENENLETRSRIIKDIAPFNDQTEWRPPVKHANISKLKLRGEKLLEMIRLDISSMTLLTMAPIPYDIFIKVYGKKNTQQRTIQTNEDSLNQDVQTDPIKYKDKWTQFPIKYHNWEPSIETSLTQFYSDRRGVGDDNPVQNEVDVKLSYNMSKLNRFLDYASEVMVLNLEESGLVERGRASAVKSDLPFSQGCLLIKNSNQKYLSGRSASHLTFSPHNPNYILVVYSPLNYEEDDLSCRCLICLWNVLGGDAPPRAALLAPSTVTSVAFDSLHSNIIYAGLTDGGVCVWELKDRGIKLNIGDINYNFRPPSYSTCGIMGDEGHFSAVISVQSIAFEGTKPTDKFAPGQLVSLEELGRVILWSVVGRRPWSAPQEVSDVRSDLGAAPWATLSLTQSLSITPFEQLPRSLSDVEDYAGMCTCMVKLPNMSSVLVGSDMGQVAQCSLLVFDPRRSFYQHSQSFEKPSITCIEICPTNTQLFMVGVSSGVVRLHLIGRSRPLRIFSCLLGSVMPPVAALAISSQRPGLVFASHSNSTMYIWNICESDIAPLFSVTFKGTDLSMTALTTNGKSSYLAIADADSVQIHKIKKEYTTTNPLEMKIFSTYVTLV